MKGFREQWPYYRRRIYLLLGILSFVLGVHGLFVYYQAAIPRVWQRISAILYGTLKLYLFTPPLSPEAKVTWTYELAKWLAPIMTSALVLTALINRLRHWRNNLLNLRGERLLVFGLNDLSESFLLNLHLERAPFRLSLVSAKAIPDEVQKTIEKRYTSVHIAEIEKYSGREIREFLLGLGVRRLRHLMLMEEKQIDNVGLFLKLLPYLPDKKFDIHLRLSNSTLAKSLQQELRSFKNQGKFTQVELHFFDPSTLTVDYLFSRSNTAFLLQRVLKELQVFRNQEMKHSDDIMEQASLVHVLILGFNELTLPIIRRCINDLVVNDKKIRFSLLDERAHYHFKKLIYNHPQWTLAAEFKSFEAKPSQPGFIETLQEILQQKVTLGFLNYEDSLNNLEVLHQIRGLDPSLPLTFRMKREQPLRKLLKSNTLLFYGDDATIMSSEIVLRESLERHARRFNQAYNEAAMSVGAGAGTAWEDLSEVKKKSSRQSASHAQTKEELMKALFDGTPEELREKVKALAENLQQIREDYPAERFQEGMQKLFQQEAYAEYLSRIEHQRWCNAYYLMGFRLGESKDEIKKTHPCLNGNWQELMGELFYQCHPEYDLISILALFAE